MFNALAQQCPVEPEAYHGILCRITGRINQVLFIAEKLLQLVHHQVAAETFNAEIEEKGISWVVAQPVARIVIIAVK